MLVARLFALAALCAITPAAHGSQPAAVVSIDAGGSAALAAAVRVASRQITTKSNATVRVDDPTAAIHLALSIESSLGPERFAITDLPAGKVGTAIAGGDARGVYYGLGRLLRNSTFGTSFTPGSWRGRDGPILRGGFRAHYFALHFANFYEAAPIDDVKAYIEDMALWGVNALVIPMPGPGSFPAGDSGTIAPDEPQIQPAINRTRVLLQHAVDIGISAGLIICPNLGYDSGHFLNHTKTGHSPFPLTPFPDPQHVRGYSGALSCGFRGEAYLLQVRRQMFEHFADIPLDWMVSWPYDTGGCGCEDDWPWGAKGFPRLSTKMATMARSIFPDMKMIGSTWCFDKPIVNSSEYVGLDSFIRAERAARNASNFTYVMVDDHGDFPRWPLDHGGGQVGGLSLVNFPEISMWGRGPWGGWGANPLPNRFEGLWLQTEGHVLGGMPYSEGIYEDMNAVIAWRHYWAGTNANDTLREYIRFEFSSDCQHVEAAMEAIQLLEQTWAGGPKDPVASKRAFDLLSAVDVELAVQAKTSWRWRLLMLRATIDHTLTSNGHQMCGPTLCKAFAELVAIQHNGKSAACGVPHCPCVCTAPPAPPAPCPAVPYNRSEFVPWVRVENQSNSYGIIENKKNVGVPFLGVFNTELECRQACEARPNCTQYSYQGKGQGNRAICSPWDLHCYGRCDTKWNLKPVPCVGVAARRVNASIE